MSRIGLALIGLGPGSEPHDKSINDLSARIDLRWAAARGEAATAAFASRTGWPTTTDLDAVLADPTVQAVLVVTPPASHLDICARAFAAGKHVLVEKPLDLTTARAERLVAAGRAADRRLGVVLQSRFRPAGLRLRALLRSGRLGRIEAATMSASWWRPQSYYDELGRGTLARDGGGVLLTQAIHPLDLFRSLLGVRRVVAAQIRTTALHRMETEDFASALLELENGAPASITVTTAAYPGRPERSEVIGTLGTALLDGTSLHAAFLDGSEERVAGDIRTGSGASIMDFDHTPHRDLLADFLDAIEQNRDPGVTGEDALATQRLIDDILAAGRRQTLVKNANPDSG